MSGLRYIAQGGMIFLIIFCMTCDLCVATTTSASTTATTTGTTTTTTPSEIGIIKGRISSLYKSCNDTTCSKFSDPTQLDNQEQVCMMLEALNYCMWLIKDKCNFNWYSVPNLPSNCKSRKQKVIEAVKDLANKCDGNCNTILKEVGEQDTLEQTCGKVDSLDNCMSISCDYFQAYQPTLENARHICDGCVYHGVSVILFLLGLALSKWITL